MAVVPAQIPPCWDWFRYILPKNVQERVYEPLLIHMLEDYIEAKAKATTPGKLRLVRCIFWWRAFYGAAHCTLAMAFDFKFLWLTRLLRTNK